MNRNAVKNAIHNTIPMTRLVTAESVCRGHPDKFGDQIAGRILDAHLRKNPLARVAVEVFATASKIITTTKGSQLLAAFSN